MSYGLKNGILPFRRIFSNQSFNDMVSVQAGISFPCKPKIDMMLLYLPNTFRTIMKKVTRLLFSFLFFILFHNSLYSQSIKWSQPLQDNKKFPYLLILGENESGNFYILRSNISLDNNRERTGFRNRTYALQYYSSEMSLLWDKELVTSYENGHISDVKLINGHVVVASYIIDKKNKLYYFYTQIIDDGGKWIAKPELLDSLSSDVLDENNKPSLISSRDQSLFAFSYRKNFKNKKNQSFKVIVMDTNLVLKYKKEIEIPISSQLFVPLDFILTNQGSFYILGIHYVNEKKIKAPDQSYYELYGYSLLLDRSVNTIIRSENKFLTDVGITADNINRSIVIAGFYSDKTTYSTAGVFYYALNEDSLHETKAINTPFSTEYLQEFFDEKKEDRELVNFSIDRLIVRKDGGVALIAESRYETNRSYFDYYMQSFVSHTYYHYGNLMVLSVNPDGNILWNNVIKKDQNSIDDAGFFSSYYCAVTGGRLVAFYNKYIEDNSSVLISFLEAGGAQKTNVLFNELGKITILAKSAQQIDDETILIPAYKENKYYIIQISF